MSHQSYQDVEAILKKYGWINSEGRPADEEKYGEDLEIHPDGNLFQMAADFIEALLIERRKYEDPASIYLEDLGIKIRINKCSDSLLWYADKVGSIFDVKYSEFNRHVSQGLPEDVFWCIDPSGGLNFVKRPDAEIVD